MALTPLLRLTFWTNANPPFVAGDEVRVYYNDSTLTEVVTLNGTLTTNPTYNIQLGLATTYDASGVATMNISGYYLDTNGNELDVIDIPTGIKPKPFVPPADELPIVIPQPGPGNDITLPPPAPVPTRTPSRAPVDTGNQGNAIDVPTNQQP